MRRRILVNLTDDLRNAPLFLLSKVNLSMSEQDFLRAAFDGDLPTMRAWAEAGGNVNVTNRHGMSALMLAIWNARGRDVVEYLVRIGIDLAIRQPSSGWRALTYAAVNGHVELLELLLASGDRLDPDGADAKALAYAVQFRNSDTAALLLEHGASVDERDDDGRTPLMRAARNGDPVALALLLHHRADATIADAAGDTPLHFAASRASTENIRLLLEHGARPDVTNHAGATPIDVARARKKSRNVAAMEAFAKSE